jgi:hypothetical protein
MGNGRLARGDPPENVGRHCGRGDGDDRNLCLTMQTRALHPAALDRAVFLAPSRRLGLWVVENDSGRAGVFRIRNLRVVGAVAAPQDGDISASKIRKFFGGTTGSRAGHRPNVGGDVCAAG